MDNASYTTLSRQLGLMREMRIIANNLANMDTTGFRAQQTVFSEFIRSTNSDADSLSMSSARIAIPVARQGSVGVTGGALDLAIEGEGFFVIATPDGERLTRAGHFTTTSAGELVNQDGFSVLDSGGTPVLLPLGGADIAVGTDGTLSSNGRVLSQIAIVKPQNPMSIRHQGGTTFVADAWEPDEASTVRQGALEASNVNPVTQISRMIEVQRAYELGQKLLDREDERVKTVISTLSR